MSDRIPSFRESLGPTTKAERLRNWTLATLSTVVLGAFIVFALVMGIGE